MMQNTQNKYYILFFTLFISQNQQKNIMSTAGAPITCKAMVLRTIGKLDLETVTVAPPQKGEVRLKTLYSAVCHTDAMVLGGSDPETVVDKDSGVILGHEGLFEVESVGEGVDATLYAPGTIVIGSYIPECKQSSCIFCPNPKTNLCSTIRVTQGNGVMPDGTSRFTDANGKPMRHFMGLSAFSQYTVVSEWSLAPVPQDLLDEYKDNIQDLSLFGCGLTTGWGSAAHAGIEKGDSVVVIGLGAVGLAAVASAKAKGAKVFGVDINPAKKELALKLGVDVFINPKELPEGVTLEQHITEQTPGGFGVNFAFECVGATSLMESALKMTLKGTGKAFIIGVAAGASVNLRTFLFVSGRSLSGYAFGNTKPSNLTALIKDFGKTCSTKDFVTNQRPLEDINAAFDDMHHGIGIRTIIKMD